MARVRDWCAERVPETVRRRPAMSLSCSTRCSGTPPAFFLGLTLPDARVVDAHRSAVAAPWAIRHADA
ncbi:hypothetical protein ABGB16_18585 [Micromonospora sp. B11E3]|uniref:hypothetical protein n=1 Tax=Micromonospora sp. B11E3 TaxID=3153562 RepID=UPI00325DE3FB